MIVIQVDHSLNNPYLHYIDDLTCWSRICSIEYFINHCKVIPGTIYRLMLTICKINLSCEYELNKYWTMFLKIVNFMANFNVRSFIIIKKCAYIQYTINLLRNALVCVGTTEWKLTSYWNHTHIYSAMVCKLQNA